MNSAWTKAKLALAAGVLAVAGTTANAAAISVTTGQAAALAAHAAFVGTITDNLATENFDSMGTNPSYGANDNLSWENSANSFATNVGLFTLTTPSTTTNADNLNLKIESLNTGESDRETLAGGSAQDLWLDSNDAKLVTWEINTGATFNSIGFLFSDPNDQGARVKINYANGQTADYQLTTAFGSGSMHFVKLFDLGDAISATIVFDNGNSAYDGWGIDDIAVGVVPEPATLALLGAGLVGLGMARRRGQ